MSRTVTAHAVLLAVLSAISTSPMAQTTGAAPEKKLSDYLVDIDAGPVAANELLGVQRSAVSEISTPKDLVFALQGTQGKGSKGGSGFAVSPARMGWEPLSVTAADYASKKSPMARIWGGTVLSYAQADKTLASKDYKQDALALQVQWYLDPADDPVVKAYQAFRTHCAQPLLTSQDDVAKALLARLAQSRANNPGQELTPDERTAVETAAKEDVAYRTLATTAKGTSECVKKAYDEGKAAWNATRFALGVGQGWIKAADGGNKYSLGQHLVATAAIGGKALKMENGLLQLTVRRVSREVDLQTLATVPVYKASTLSALRFTQGFGSANTYVLAEISNAKANKGTESNGAFKSALGIDQKIGANLWLELRYGRARTEGGTGTDGKAHVERQSTLMKPASA
jgi:hypothetical protein